MKNLSKLFIVFALGVLGSNIASAQSSLSDDKAIKAREVDSLIKCKSFVFEATREDLKKGEKPLPYHAYDVAISKDTLIAYLPTKSGGILKFDCTNYGYNTWKAENGDMIIVLNPNTSMSDVKELRLDITPLGHASLSVKRPNKIVMAFDGYVKQESY